ncbi:hypothetical protein [Streptomyces odontomachi]|uniref:hypothetical protein n=1 Tax=Streptomyces odontomachi TaxID=2944940 RepID=UPI00210E1F4F|nr:hypothetical protein [Streptomyces sp. ODS25]
MSATPQANLPIYARLVEERGDVPADARQTAEETWRRVSAVMNFGLARQREEPGRRRAR